MWAKGCCSCKHLKSCQEFSPVFVCLSVCLSARYLTKRHLSVHKKFVRFQWDLATYVEVDEWRTTVCSMTQSKVKIKVTSSLKLEIRPFSFYIWRMDLALLCCGNCDCEFSANLAFFGREFATKFPIFTLQKINSLAYDFQTVWFWLFQRRLPATFRYALRSCVCRQARRSVRWPYDADDKTRIVELFVANDHSQVLSWWLCHQTMLAKPLCFLGHCSTVLFCLFVCLDNPVTTVSLGVENGLSNLGET